MTGAINALSMRRNFTPEPFAWDRNDIGFIYRKHDKISGGDAQNSSRWRAPRHPPSSYHRRGWTPSRYDDGFQSSNGRYNGGRGSRRESRGYLRRSAIRRHVAPMRSVAAPISSPPPPPPPPPLPLKDLYDKNSGDDDDQRLDQDRDQECSFGLIGWKLLKWKRRGSISSVETEEGQEVRKGSLEVTVAKFGEEMAARFCESLPVRKKPRLKWGQGLAMYEKQKVGGLSNSETTSKVLGLAGSMAPITPCSVACSSSGTKDRTFSEALNAENDTSHCREASAVDTQNCSEEPHVKLDQLPPVSMLTSLKDLLHAEATCTGDSTFSRNTAKLQSFKADILNELEKSECEIDLLENELKSLYEDGKYSSSPPCVESANVASKVSSNLSQVVSSPLTVMREPAKQICLSIKHKFKVSYSNGKILETPPSYYGKPASSGSKVPSFLDLGESAVTGNGFGSSSTNVTLNMSSPHGSSPPCVESANIASKVSSNLSQVVSSPLTVMREPAKQICLSIKHKFKVSYSNGKILETPPSYYGKPASSGSKEPSFLDLGESAVTGNGFGSSSTNVTLNMSSPHGSSPPCVESANIASKVSSNLSQVVSSPLTVMREPAKQICLSIKHKFKVSYSNGKILQTPPSYNGKPVSSGTKEPPFLDLGESAVTGNGFGSSSTNVTLNMSSSSKKDNNLMDLIMASNRNASQKASQAFRGAFPTSPQQFDIWESDRLSSCRRNDMRISERLALYKHQIRFKEHVLALKFRAFHHLWMDDLQLLSIKNKRLKSQKCFELCSSQWSSRRNHSIQSRSKLLAGNSALVPSANIVDFTSNLLSGKPQIKLYRENLKMPALILDEKERRNSRFVTNNNLIEDPISFEKERSMINPWTEEERGGFMEMLAVFGKDFVKISSFLSHKTTADCIEFYYKNHKSESFKDVKKQLDLRKQRHCISANSYHVTSGENIIHGSKVAQRNDNARNDSSKISRGSHSLRVDSIEMPVCEKEMAEAVSFSATGLSSPEKITYWKKRSRFLTADTQYTCSDESIGELDLVDWTDEEKFMFIRALGMYGKNFAKISQSLGTKSREQCKAFFCKARKCLSLDQIHTGARELVKVENSASDSPLKPFSASRTELEHQKTRTAAEVHGKREVELHQVSTVLKSVFRGSDAKENDISTQVPNQKKLKREMNSEGQLNFELNAMREGSMVLNSKPGEELRPYAIAEKSTAKPGDRKIFEDLGVSSANGGAINYGNSNRFEPFSGFVENGDRRKGKM